jgi:hypothetical protein
VPTPADLDDPLGFVASDTATDETSEDDFDAALAELLDQESPEKPDDDGPERQA